MRIIICQITLLISFTISARVIELKPFVTDGCTGFIDGPKEAPTLWQHCCLMHDMKYWYGGSIANRDQADLALKSCVQAVAGDDWANIIYLGVRAGHQSPIKNKYQWSWGWTVKRPLIPLTIDEKNYVIHELNRLPFDQKYIHQVIDEYFKNI